MFAELLRRFEFSIVFIFEAGSTLLNPKNNPGATWRTAGGNRPYLFFAVKITMANHFGRLLRTPNCLPGIHL